MRVPGTSGSFLIAACERRSAALRILLQDLRFSARILTGSPGSSAVAVLTLALGIASATTVFSWIDGLLWHPFPGAARSGELAVLEMSIPNAPNGGTSISWMDYLVLGRLLVAGPGNDTPGAYPVVVISERLWRREFSADPNIVGKLLRVNRRPLTIVGVAPAPLCSWLRWR